MNKKYKTNNSFETQDLGKKIAKEILLSQTKKEAIVLWLKGNLGSGKTTFLQGFAKGLGIKEKILSPTFVVMKRFELKNKQYKNFYHIDLYRLKNKNEIKGLKIDEIIKDSKNIVAIEWPEKIKKILWIKKFMKIYFKFINENSREIIFKSVL